MGGALASLIIKLAVDASGVGKGMADADRVIGSGASKAASRWKAAGAIVAGAGAMMTRSVGRIEDAQAHFQSSTGASAAEAEHFGKVLNATSGSSLVSMDNIASSAEGIRSDMGLVGDEADAQLKRFVAFERATGQGAEAVKAFDDIQDAWNVTSTDTQAIMDTLIAGQHKYGGSISGSQSALAGLAPVLQGLGMDWQDGTKWINAANSAGIDATGMVQSLSKALKTVKSPEEFQALVDDIAATEDPLEQSQKALALFGKSGAKMGQLIHSTHGDLSQFGFDTDEVAGKTDEAQQALDGTWGSKFKLLMKGAGAAITGFGMNFGSAITGIGSAITGASALGLGKHFGALGQGAAKAFKGGFGRITGLMSGITGAITGSGLWEKAGQLSGSKFGKAFKIGAAVFLAALAVDELKQLSELKTANQDTVKVLDKGMGDFLSTMPTRAEAEAKLAGLKAIPATLDGVQSAVMSVGDLGKGNVLGSVFDGLFGANPAQVLSDQEKMLEDYLKQDLPSVITSGGNSLDAAISSANAKTAATAVESTKKISHALGAIDFAAAEQAVADGTSTMAGAISAGLGTAVSAAQAGMDLINTALQKPPKLMSYKQRLAQYAKAIKTTVRNLHAAIAAHDPVNAAFQEKQLLDLEAAYGEFKGSTTKTWDEVVADAKAAGFDLGGVEKKVRHGKKTTANVAKTAAVTEAAASAAAAAAATKAADDHETAALRVRTAAASLPGAFAAAVPPIQGSFGSMLASARGFLGTLLGISAWSPPNIAPTRPANVGAPGHAGGGPVRPGMAYTVGEHGPERLQLGSQSGLMTRHMSAIGGGGGGGDVHIHVGTLIANDSGLDELQRRMERRLRLQRRDRRLVGDVN